MGGVRGRPARPAGRPQTTDVVELVHLRSYSEAGLEAIAMLRGEAWRQRVSYYGTRCASFTSRSIDVVQIQNNVGFKATFHLR